MGKIRMKKPAEAITSESALGGVTKSHLDRSVGSMRESGLAHNSMEELLKVAESIYIAKE